MPATLNLHIRRNGTPLQLFEPLFRKAVQERFPGSKVTFHNDLVELNAANGTPATLRAEAKNLPGVIRVDWMS